MPEGTFNAAFNAANDSNLNGQSNFSTTESTTKTTNKTFPENENGSHYNEDTKKLESKGIKRMKMKAFVNSLFKFF